MTSHPTLPESALPECPNHCAWMWAAFISRQASDGLSGAHSATLPDQMDKIAGSFDVMQCQSTQIIA